MKKRIHLVDAIRGFALFGIILIHSIEQFDVANYPESSKFLAALDIKIIEIVFFLFAGKAYSIFSIMFGFSFCIQMKNSEERGINFSKKFIWRLIILFIIGYIYSLFYYGEVLTVFALLGLILVPLYKLSNKWLVVIMMLFIIQIPTIYHVISAFINPDYSYSNSWHHFKDVSTTFMNGSLLEVIEFNSVKGHLAKWQYLFNVGRYLQMIGLFIFGLLLGKINYFEQIKKNRKTTLKIIFLTSILSFVFYYSPFFLEESTFSSIQIKGLKSFFKSGFSFVFTILLIALFITIYNFIKQKSKTSIFSYYGKMSLTNYVTQALFGTFFFYGYGLGMYQYFGATYCLLFGFILFIIQAQLSKLWIKKFYYGPLEWLWRAFTFMDFNLKFKKPTHQN